jgi:hypothetical protein
MNTNDNTSNPSLTVLAHTTPASTSQRKRAPSSNKAKKTVLAQANQVEQIDPSTQAQNAKRKGAQDSDEHPIKSTDAAEGKAGPSEPALEPVASGAEVDAGLPTEAELAVGALPENAALAWLPAGGANLAGLLAV